MTAPTAHDPDGFSTGIAGLDDLFRGLISGDNVVWEVSDIADYAAVAVCFADAALRRGRRVIYFRFARHAPLISEGSGARVIRLEADAGFEHVLVGIRRTVATEGPGVHYVFDSLSDLTADWFSDQMVGNFFRLVCPLVLSVGGLAYFAYFRNQHSPFALAPVSRTTQLLVSVYRHDDRLFLHPLKASERTRPEAYALHEWEGDHVAPVADSHTIALVLGESPRASLGLTTSHLGVWSRTIVQAESVQARLRAGEPCLAEAERLRKRLLRMAVSREERLLELAERHLSLGDVIVIASRMLGTGLIGGKSTGMLLARAILEQGDPAWRDRFETHDSFYIPSDVFYTFLVYNDCWELRRSQLEAEDYAAGAETARDRIMAGAFPEHIVARFAAMLEHYGQSPIIVRSSSLLEDNFGNSFAGKYDSVFCANRGAPEERMAGFLDAVKTVYASTMGVPALSYRARHDLLDRDEQMGLLVQRVSGSRHGRYYFPQIAGVGYSFNPYVWSPDIDPRAGMIRLVFGLGTRAVDRADEDSTRLVAMNAPDRRPGGEEERDQQRVDTLDLESGELRTLLFGELLPAIEGVPITWFASRDRRAEAFHRSRGMRPAPVHALTFERLLSESGFVDDMREMLAALETAYACPVDVEFTANFDASGAYRINIVQCRPLQTHDRSGGLEPLPDIAPEDLLFTSSGPVIGRSRHIRVDRIIEVCADRYAALPEREKHSVARAIGVLNRMEPPGGGTVLLCGPGRWGTTTPSLGVPVSFAEIDRVAVLCELVAMREDLIPDVSFGTHFFGELVERDTLYVAVAPGQAGHAYAGFAARLGAASPDRFAELMPDAHALADVIRVFDAPADADGRPVVLRADTPRQTLHCYLAPRTS